MPGWVFGSAAHELSTVSRATLLVIQGIDQGVRFEVGAAGIGLGRGAQNTIRIHDTEVSRTHARLQPIDGRFVLEDLKSSNGTYVNGQAIGSRDLTDGDQIQIGRTVMLFSLAGRAQDPQQAAERVEMRGGAELEDRAQIVGEAGPHEAPALVALDPAADPAALSQNVANLQVLYRISEEAVRPTMSIDQLLSRILELAIEVAGADRGCMLLRNPATGELEPQAFRHRRRTEDVSRMPVSRSIVDYVLQNRQGVRTTDARSDTRFAPGQSIFQAGIREAICVPMQGRYELTGVIYIDITTPPERVILQGGAGKFTEDLLRLMVAVGRQSALAVEDHRYRQALVKAERLAAVGQTITILSHHIKNILQGVRGGSYLIDMGLKDHNEDLVQKGWSIVEKNQGRIYHLVMDMLTFSKERQPVLKRADLNETVAEVCDLLQGRARELNAAFEFKPTPDLPATAFDTEGIHRAILNILTNAFDAVEEGELRRVTVETGFDPAARAVSVVVADTGPGIRADKLAQIFNIFESTKGARGTGIGLAVSRKIIREHGGEIHAASEPGRGAVFTLEWPVIDEEQPSHDDQTLA